MAVDGVDSKVRRVAMGAVNNLRVWLVGCDYVINITQYIGNLPVVSVLSIRK